MNLYNEIDPRAAGWLRNLVAGGRLAPGRVDDRDMRGLSPQHIAAATQVHLFAGIGGWPLALRMAGWPDDAPVWTGSAPCQPFSTAGTRKGTDDDRHLWPDFLQLLDIYRPGICFGEQVAGKTGRAWFATVSADMEALGYSVVAFDLCAAGVKAPHVRQRLYWVAISNVQRHERLRLQLRSGRQEQATAEDGGDRPDVWLGHADSERAGGHGGAGGGAQAQSSREGGEAGPVGHLFGASSPAANPWDVCDWHPCSDGTLRPSEPGAHPLVDGVPNRLVKLRGYGNALVVPLAATVVASVIDILTE